jgi:hypothetical protein
MEFDDIVSELRDEYKHIEMILITSPTERCGVTLVQRMFNAGHHSIIYGENYFVLFKMPVLFTERAKAFSRRCEIVSSTLNEFMSGARGIDASALQPNYASYIKERLRLFYKMLEFYQTESRTLGFAHWGFKCPLPKDIPIAPVFQLLPHRKFVVVDRDLRDVAKSLHSRWPAEYSDADAYRRLAQRWFVNRATLQRWTRVEREGTDRFLYINYEQWMENPGAVADALENTFNIPISRDEIKRRVNVHSSDAAVTRARALSDGGYYIPPRDLPAEAENWLAEGLELARASAGHD